MLLPTRRVEKPWGREDLPAPFVSEAGKRVGEIWFEPPAAMAQLLVKFIFTSEKLSVQVHPNDAQSEAAGIGRQGKEECWLVVSAEAGATLGVGFADDLDEAAMRAAALDGSIERMLAWHPVKAGDFFYIPANTVHAIGPGVSIIEIQQNSDITYRLFDYGRPRELHLDEAIAVASGTAHDSAHRSSLPKGGARLVEGPFFTLDYIDGQPSAEIAARYDAPLLVIPLEQSAEIGGVIVSPGQCGLASKLSDIRFAANVKCLITKPIARLKSENPVEID